MFNMKLGMKLWNCRGRARAPPPVTANEKRCPLAAVAAWIATTKSSTPANTSIFPNRNTLPQNSLEAPEHNTSSRRMAPSQGAVV
jgi:hypothetical protein